MEANTRSIFLPTHSHSQRHQPPSPISPGQRTNDTYFNHLEKSPSPQEYPFTLGTHSNPRAYPSTKSSNPPPETRMLKVDEPVEFFNFEKVVQEYGERPELLELILSSKVEEDRRRAEEAKLRQKEIDYILKRNKTETDASQNAVPVRSWRASTGQPTTSVDQNSETDFALLGNRTNTPSSIEILGTSAPARIPAEKNPTNDQPFNGVNSPPSHLRVSSYQPYSVYTNPADSHLNESIALRKRSSFNHPTPYPLHGGRDADPPTRESWPLNRLQPRGSDSTTSTRRDSTRSINNLLSTFSISSSIMLPPISAPHQRISQLTFDPSTQDRQNDSTLTPTPVLTPYAPLTTDQDKGSLSSASKMNVDTNAEKTGGCDGLDFGITDYFSKIDAPIPPGNVVSQKSTSTAAPAKMPIPPTPFQPNPDLPNPARPKRRRREMQNISMIIETREFPYNDEYLWKNNGNTVHRKSGHKSIYYKCSNSSKGCSVNKTVTFKEDGEYLIKYRGQHLVECNRIKHIIDI
ncbi:hypothetical protein CLU79DRAFT_737607 [Phycomyces nitens]|nr:hypothetical protein CLU79DRAFT_737607 [Phycomyces nitens]